MRRGVDGLILFADLGGTLVFAVEGALAAIGGDLDFLGVMVLAFSTALGGGVIRDLLIGAAPPQALRDWRYATLAFAAGAATFLTHPLLRQIPGPVLISLDAAGLSLFAVAGAEKALVYAVPRFIAILMGASPRPAAGWCATSC